MAICTLDRWMIDWGLTLSSGAYRAVEEMHTRIAILLALLGVVAFDLAVNDATGPKAIVGYSNALMWKMGPI